MRQSINLDNTSIDEEDEMVINKAPIHTLNDPTPRLVKSKSDSKPSNTRKFWILLVNIFTFWLPPFILLRFMNHETMVAFKEKIFINMIILGISILFFFLVVGLGFVICPQRNTVLNPYEIKELSSASYPLVIAYGYFYLIKDVYKNHVNDAGYISAGAFKQTVLGQDVSAMFIKPANFKQFCPNLLPSPPAGWDNIKREIPEPAMTIWTIHSEKNNKGEPRNYLTGFRSARKGAVARDMNWITTFLLDDPVTNRILVAYGRIYDVSAYLNAVQKPKFLGAAIESIIVSVGKTGQDATQFLEQVKQKEGFEKWQNYMNCMDAMFFVGVIGCVFSSAVVLSASIFIVLIIGLKFLAALHFTPKNKPQPPQRYVIITVSCYNEDFDALSSCFESIASTDYQYPFKMLFVVVDGRVKGLGSDRYSSDIVLEIFGHCDKTQETTRYSTSSTKLYNSLGTGLTQPNFAKVYGGVYHSSAAGTALPYLVIVKTGAIGTNGNRGKRDSQLILLGFLHRLHHDFPLSPLDLEIQYQFLYVLGINSKNYEFVLFVDGDTVLEKTCITFFVSKMEEDSKCAGICGESQIANQSASWVTFIQVYEYWLSHHMSKSFESLFGSVTCLPGCFSMYRIFNPVNSSMILINSRLIKEYSLRLVQTLHLKNLLALGEDRYLTTLVLKIFPEMKTRFVGEAKCQTTVPKTWSVFLSQRRRWINSTVHNLLELSLLTELSGVFIFSIRFIVFMDLISTILSPAGFVYFVYLFIVLFTQITITIPLVSIILLCAIYGLQVALFLFKLQFAHLGWLILYLLAMPLYTFVLPVYSFWHMDDFNWGQTRKIQEDSDFMHGITIESPVISGTDQQEKEFDESEIPVKRWDEYEMDGGLARRLEEDEDNLEIHLSELTSQQES